VLDQLVRDWLAENAGWSLRLDWRVDDYRSYVDTVCAWAVELGIEPADVEMLMFTQAASSRSSQWSQPELLEDAQPPAPAVEAVDPDAHEVLAALDEAAAAFSELAGLTAAEDFERGLRHLRRIVIARRRVG